MPPGGMVGHMTRCVHCGDPAAGEYSVLFDRGAKTREIELELCSACVESFEESPDVKRVG